MGLDTKPLSTLHEKASYDVADFEVPTGREEEWRFTPLRRLRNLHKGTAADGGKVLLEVEAAPRSPSRPSAATTRASARPTSPPTGSARRRGTPSPTPPS